MPDATPLLAFEDLQVEFRLREKTVHAVKGVSFHVHPGEVVALVGESGSGKSVSAQSAMQLIPSPPAAWPAGRILWKGENILEMGTDRLVQLRGNEIGMIFQEPMTALNPLHTCGRQVAEALELHTDLDEAGRRARVLELFDEVGLPDPPQRFDQYPHEMSGGMRQRVCISIALACGPELLIADEPTTALDVTIQAQILELLRRLQRERGMAVLFITHDLGVVADIADRVVMMWRGEVMEQGDVHQIFSAPSHPYTKGLLACRPTLGRRRDRLPVLGDFLDGEATMKDAESGEKD